MPTPTREQIQRALRNLGPASAPPPSNLKQFMGGFQEELTLGYYPSDIKERGIPFVFGQVAGALAPTVATLGATSAIPLLRAAPLAMRSAAAFGALGALREPDEGDRLQNMMVGAIQGAIIGPSLRPAATPLIAATTGAAASLVPYGFAEDFPGIEDAGKDMLFNALLAAVLQTPGYLIHRKGIPRVSSEAPPPGAAETVPIDRPATPPPIPPPRTIPEANLMEAELPPEMKATVAAPPENIPDIAPTPIPINLPLRAIGGEQLNLPGMHGLAFLRESDQPLAVMPKPSSRVEQPTIELRDKLAVKAVIDGAIERIRGRVLKGRVIGPLDPVTADYFPDDAAGVVIENGVKFINTKGLERTEVDELVRLAGLSDDVDIRRTLQATKRGLAGGISRKAPPGQTAAELRKGQQGVRPSQMSREVGAAEILDNVVSVEDETLKSVADRLLYGEEFEAPPQQMKIIASLRDKTSSEVNRQLRRVAEETGKVTDYATHFKALADQKILVTPGEGTKLRLIHPDGSTHELASSEELEAFVRPFLKPTTEVPIYSGPDRPPMAEPIQVELYPPGDLAKLERLRAADFEVPNAIRLKQALKETPVITEEAGYIEQVNDALPPSEKLAHVQSEGQAKAIEVTPTSDSIIVENKITGETIEVRSDADIRLKVKLYKMKIERASKHEVGSPEKIRLLAEAEAIRQKIPDEVMADKSVVSMTNDELVLELERLQDVSLRKRSREERTAARKAAKIVAESNNTQTFREEDLRSIFRRHWASLTTEHARNQARKKYQRYERYFPPYGTQLLKGESPLPSLSGVIDHRISPVLDLTPPGAPPLTPVGAPPTLPSPGEGPPNWMHVDPNDLSVLGSRHFWQIMKRFSLDTEQKSKGLIQAFRLIFDPVDRGHQQMSSEMGTVLNRIFPSWKKFIVDSAGRNRISLWLKAKDKEAAIAEFGIKPREVEAGKLLRQLFDELWKLLGFTDKKGKQLSSAPYLEDYLPEIRKEPKMSERQLRERVWRSRTAPADYTFFSTFEREGGISVQEMDAFKLFQSYLYHGMRHKYLAEPHRIASDYINKLQLPPEAFGIRSSLTHFLDSAWGIHEPSVKRLNESIKGILGKIGIHMPENDRTNFVNMLLQLNVGANIAWRIPLAMRNTWQVMFAYPFLGARAFARGSRIMTKAGWAEAVRDGIISPETDVPLVNELVDQFGILNQMTRKGTKSYRNVDNLTRGWAYLGMKDKLQDASMRFIQGGSVKDFIARSELDSTLHPVEIETVIHELQAGRVEEAVKTGARYFADNTNFIYRAGNAPEAFKGVAGRLFGQFGIWPTSYINYIDYLHRFGSPAGRAKKIARFYAMNTAFGLVGAELGVDFWKWIMFGPMVFTGGPFVGIASDAAKVARAIATGNMNDDYEAQIALNDLKTSALSQVIPGSGAVRDVLRMLEQTDAKSKLTSILTGQEPQEMESIFPSRPRPMSDSMLPQRLRDAARKR